MVTLSSFLWVCMSVRVTNLVWAGGLGQTWRPWPALQPAWSLSLITKPRWWKTRTFGVRRKQLDTTNRGNTVAQSHAPPALAVDYVACCCSPPLFLLGCLYWNTTLKLSIANEFLVTIIFVTKTMYIMVWLQIFCLTCNINMHRLKKTFYRLRHNQTKLNVQLYNFNYLKLIVNNYFPSGLYIGCPKWNNKTTNNVSSHTYIFI